MSGSDCRKLISRGKPWACVTLVVLWTALAYFGSSRPTPMPCVRDIVVSAAFMCILFLGCTILTAYSASGEKSLWQILGHDLDIRREWKRALVTGIVIGVAMTVLSCGLSTALTHALGHFGITPKDQDVVKLFSGGTRNVKITLAASVLLMNPAVEEIFFRYALGSTLLGVTRSVKWSAIATAALFALVHANLLAFLPLMVVSLCCTHAMRRTGNILAPTTAHVIHNAASLVSLLLAGQ